jgi:transcriptional regulator with XRE-family HTH domain
MSNKKSGNPVDHHVGAKVRARRLALGLSQTVLADGLGLTFQQVQKYEKGSNRIGASRLQQIASLLKVEPSFFFVGAPGQTAKGGYKKAEDFVTDFLADKDAPALIDAFMAIKGRKLRRELVRLVEQIARA